MGMVGSDLGLSSDMLRVIELEEEGEHAVGGQLLEADAEELPGHAPGVTGDDSEGALVSASPVIFVTLTLTHL